MPIARFAVRRRVTVAMIALAIIVLGLFAFPRLPVALLPSFSPPVINVSVTYPNESPESMETLVTRPIENAVSRVNGIDQITSSSQEGQTNVSATFHYGVNLDTAAVDVQEQVDRIRRQLPNDPNLQQPQISKFDSNSLPVVNLYVTDKNMALRDLGDLFTNTLADEFSSVSGVAAVTVSSDQQRAILIEPNAATLAADGISLSQIVSRISQENVNLPAGIVQIANGEYQVRTNALYASAQEISNTIVAEKNGAPIYMHDIAKVTDGIAEQRSFQRLDGVPALSISINAQPDANVVQAAYGIYQKIHDIEARYPGMHVGVVFDQQGFITQAINALEHTAIYGAVLAVLVILLFLHSWRSTVIVAISLPISVLGTLFAAYIFGYSLNTMTLGGLALAVGLIVDDAIVVIENIYRHMARGQHVKEAAESAVGEILGAVLASSVTVITVFVPLVLIPGLQGLIFTPLALMVMVAVALSLLVAVTTVPMLSTLLLHDEKPHTNGAGKSGGAYARFTRGFDRLYERFSSRYRSVLAWSIDRPGIVVGIAGTIFVVTLIVLKLGFISTELFPASNSNYVRFGLRMPVGTALSITNRVTKDVEQRMQHDSRVVSIGAQIGSGGGFNASPRTNSANLAIELKPGTTSDQATQFVSQWQFALTGKGNPRAGSRATVTPAERASLQKLYGKPIVGLQTFGRTVDIVQSIISRGNDALQIQIFGPDVATLYHLGHDIAVPKLSLVPGISSPDTNITDSQPELDVKIDRSRAAALGLSTQTISQVVDTATSGTIASYLQLNGTQYPITVQLPPAQRRSYAAIANLPINVPSQNGGGGTNITSTTTATPGQSFSLATIPLSDVAAISLGTGPSHINRQNKQRVIDVDTPVVGVPLGQAMKAATQVMNSIALPAGYRWAYGPETTQQNDTFGSLGLVVALAILLIYMLLAAQFESLLHPLVIMTAVPLSLAGVIVALLVTHRSFGLTAFIGVLMLVGIVVKNAILVVEFTNQLRRRGLSAREAVLQAAPLRLRPILMTTLATVGGMLPLAIGLEAGSSTQAPLGTVVIGGLLCSTMLSLLVIPAIYLWTATHVEPRFGSRRKGQLTNGHPHVLEAPRTIPAPTGGD
ncbi:MAG TPA: efflux RND transporter permease subunit [Candidatus Baltobacteraceae bacterium]